MKEPVMFISLGPGDPELITLKGLKALQRADVIFCPSTLLGNGQSLSRAKDTLVALGIEPEKISLFNLSMTKERGEAIETYNNVSQKVSELYNKMFRVAVAAEGDAGFYSSIHYISHNLQAAQVPTKRVPGVPAFIACAALIGTHVTKQEEELEVVPGTITKERLTESIHANKTVVIMKPSLCEEIVKEAMHTMASVTFHYFENVGIPQKEFYSQHTLDILARKFPYFSLFIIQKQYS